LDDESSGRQPPEFKRRKGELLTQVRGGSRGALAELLELYRPFLRIWARRPANDPLRKKFDTSDVIQNTQRAALECLDSFRTLPEEDFTGKLKELLHAQVSASRKRYWRVKKRQISREQPLDGIESWNHLQRLLASPLEEVLDNAARQEERERIKLVLERLPSEDQELIHQRLWQSLEWEEIAQRHECTADAIRMRYKRAIARLAIQYRREYPKA